MDTLARAPYLLLLDADFRPLINSWPTKRERSAVYILLTRPPAGSSEAGPKESY